MTSRFSSIEVPQHHSGAAHAKVFKFRQLAHTITWRRYLQIAAVIELRLKYQKLAAKASATLWISNAQKTTTQKQKRQKGEWRCSREQRKTIAQSCPKLHATGSGIIGVRLPSIGSKKDSLYSPRSHCNTTPL